MTATVTFSEGVVVTGEPKLKLKIGDADVQASYASGSGSTALTFTYTIQAGQNDTDGISIPANAIVLNDATIKDAAGNNATLRHKAVADNANYKVDSAGVPGTLTLSNFTDRQLPTNHRSWVHMGHGGHAVPTLHLRPTGTHR